MSAERIGAQGATGSQVHKVLQEQQVHKVHWSQTFLATGAQGADRKLVVRFCCRQGENLILKKCMKHRLEC